jgi:hypothetical protein
MIVTAIRQDAEHRTDALPSGAETHSAPAQHNDR